MEKDEFIAMVAERYGVAPDYPWDDFDNAVFRHKDSRKWFALMMHIPARLLGLEGEAIIDVINLKIDKQLRFELHQEPGIYPAYHMSKVHWISVDLREMTVPMMEKLLDMSFERTKMRVDKVKCIN